MSGDLLASADRTGDSSDPSRLTMIALASAVDGMEKRSDIRLAAMDKAQEKFEDNLNRVPTQTQQAVAGLDAVFTEKLSSLSAVTEEHFHTIEERFKSVQTQFELRDKASETSSKDSKVAIDAALLAQKDGAKSTNDNVREMVDKTEKNTTKLIDGITTNAQQLAKASDDRINELRDRTTKLESQLQAANAAAAAAQAAADRATAQAQAAAQAAAAREQNTQQVTRSDQQSVRTEQHVSNSFLLSLVVAAFGAIALIESFMRAHP